MVRRSSTSAPRLLRRICATRRGRLLRPPPGWAPITRHCYGRSQRWARRTRSTARAARRRSTRYVRRCRQLNVTCSTPSSTITRASVRRWKRPSTAWLSHTADVAGRDSSDGATFAQIVIAFPTGPGGNHARDRRQSPGDERLRPVRGARVLLAHRDCRRRSILPPLEQPIVSSSAGVDLYELRLHRTARAAQRGWRNRLSRS